MTMFILRRVGMLVVTLAIGSVLIFTLEQLVPGGAAAAAAGPDADAQTIARVSHELGLDRPLPVQYGDWAANLFRGDLGTSFVSRLPVGEALLQRIPLTVQLTVLALVVGIVVGGVFGVIAGIWHKRMAGKTITTLSGLGIAFPEFWLAMILALVFALRLRWFPATGFVPLSDGLLPSLHSLVLPVVALVAGSGAVLVRQVRSAVIDVLNAPYMRTAKALGIPKWELYGVYMLRNTLIPVVTIMGLLAAGLLGAEVVNEVVFVLPGLGSLLIPAVTSKDFPVVQGVTLIYLLTVAVINIGVDLVHAGLDPRIRKAS